jgi:hypothetical protein
LSRCSHYPQRRQFPVAADHALADAFDRGSHSSTASIGPCCCAP